MKSILIIDTPNDCLLCPLCDYAVDWKGETTFYCRANEKNIDDTCEVAQWCPLKELPSNKEIKGDWENVVDVWIDGANYGYNKCLNDISGEKE